MTTKATLEDLRQKEAEFMELKKELTELRRRIPLEEVKDYTFKNSLGGQTTLSSLFGDKRSLILIHNMGTSCPYCTLWADGFNGFTPHLESQVAFVVESMDAPQIQRKFAMDRGWKFKMISSHKTDFKKDMGFLTDEGPVPGVSSFVMKDGKIYRASSALFGPGDNYCPFWDLMSLLPAEMDYENCGVDFHYFKTKDDGHEKDDCCS